jgi:hypothetical protein
MEWKEKEGRNRYVPIYRERERERESNGMNSCV